eukprot:422761-Prorocentrum_minimum.AAC.1
MAALPPPSPQSAACTPARRSTCGSHGRRYQHRAAGAFLMREPTACMCPQRDCTGHQCGRSGHQRKMLQRLTRMPVTAGGGGRQCKGVSTRPPPPPDWRARPAPRRSAPPPSRAPIGCRTAPAGPSGCPPAPPPVAPAPPPTPAASQRHLSATSAPPQRRLSATSAPRTRSLTSTRCRLRRDITAGPPCSGRYPLVPEGASRHRGTRTAPRCGLKGG